MNFFMATKKTSKKINNTDQWIKDWLIHHLDYLYGSQKDNQENNSSSSK